ncbi:unnamed protein product, partial [Gongylonema pulchrum]|uniref:F-BAR domain-containing protein n=1 Tax=Gongylonema pulchrum TaxID=637853 RepID=A0A183D4B1_9BILA
MEDSELMGEHYGRLYRRYKHMEEKYTERCNQNAYCAQFTQLLLEVDKTHDKIDTLRSAAAKNEKLYERYEKEHCISSDNMKNRIEKWKDMLQTEADAITKWCEETKSDVQSFMAGFEQASKSLHAELAKFFCRPSTSELNTDRSIVQFLENVKKLSEEADNSLQKMYTQHNKLSNFVLDH